MGNVSDVPASEIHAHYNNFWLNYLANTASYVGIALFEYFTVAWHSLIYVPMFPVFILMMLVQKWDIKSIPKANKDVLEIDLESI